MTGNIVPLHERIKRIEDEIRGVVSQSGVTQWELAFLESLKQVRFGSEKQREILSRIESKVFPTE